MRPEIAEATAVRAHDQPGAWVGHGPASHAAERGCEAFFDGALDNGDELRATLALADRSTAAELVLHGYLRWGAGVISRLRGHFATLVRDQRERRILCARDRMGIHPLFYAQADGRVLVSTSIQGLLDEPSVSTSVNRAALADHLSHRWPEPEETYFEAVRRVPPGHALVASAGDARLYRYWEPVPAGGIDWVGADELERFDALLAQAVDRCLDGDRAGLWLSGGLDSVTVATVATDRSRRRGLPDPFALSLVFPHPDANEERVQRGVADGLGLEHLVLEFFEAVGEGGMLGAALDLCRTWPAPLLSFWLPAYQTLGLEGRRRGCTTILTGGGGDEWLGVTPVIAADQLLALDLVGLYHLGRSMRSSFRVSRMRMIRNLLWTYGVGALLKAGAGSALQRTAPRALRARARRRAASQTPEWVAPDPALRAEIDERAVRAWPTPHLHDFYAREIRETLDHPLVSMELEEVFENGRRMGVPVRQPFFDADLVEFVCRVPPELLNGGGRSKGLIREAAATRFPELGFDRQKKVAATAFSRPLIAEEGLRIMREMDGTPALAEAGIVDQRKMRRSIEGALAHGGRTRSGGAYRLWDTLSLEAWLRPRL
jgi:asparagine synthase (glutamine-hydrolysing)